VSASRMCVQVIQAWQTDFLRWTIVRKDDDFIGAAHTATRCFVLYCYVLMDNGVRCGEMSFELQAVIGKSVSLNMKKNKQLESKFRVWEKQLQDAFFSFFIPIGS